MRLLVVLVVLLSGGAALAQSATARADVKIVWQVADKITATGEVSVTFTALNETVQATNKHTLTYTNNQTVNRKITIEAMNKPDSLELTASASRTSGTGNPLTGVTVTNRPADLVTAIEGGTTDGIAVVTFAAKASSPIAENTVVTIKYTITAGQ
jgi:hypothetical protein